jgi:hypothetical protein
MRKTGFLLLCFFVFQLISSCIKTDDGTYTAPITLYEKIGGTWKTNTIKEVDEIAKASSIKPDEINLTGKFSFNTFVINFAVDSNFEPTTYTVSGSAPNLFEPSGYWKLDHAFPHTDNNPTKILLYSDEAKTMLTDELIVTAIPGAKNALQFNLTRSSDGVAFVSYQYALKP